MPTYSDEELLNAIRKVAEKYGRPPTLQEICEETGYSRNVFFSHFGSWRNALEEAGYESRPPQEEVSKSDLIAELQRLGDKLGHQPTITEMNERGEYWGSTYKNHFESWAAAIEAAGYNPDETGSKIGRKKLRAELIRVGDELGKRPTYRDMEDKGEYHPNTYIREYGSWNDALEAAGFESSIGVSKSDLISEFQRLEENLDKRPSQRDMNKHGKHSHTTYIRHFGSWSDAIEAAFGERD